MRGGKTLNAEDRAWFEPLARKFERPAFQFATMMTRDRSVAEEIVQEAFARVWAAPNTPREEDDFRRWLYRTITNLARDFQRRRFVESKLRWFVPAPVDPIDEVARRAEDRELLQVLLTLPFKDRQAIYLHYFEGQSFAAVASVLGVAEPAARVRAHRALRKLRDRLGPNPLAREVLA